MCPCVSVPVDVHTHADARTHTAHTPTHTDAHARAHTIQLKKIGPEITHLSVNPLSDSMCVSLTLEG
jgi:hypothetical protein